MGVVDSQGTFGKFLSLFENCLSKKLANRRFASTGILQENKMERESTICSSSFFGNKVGPNLGRG